jgi:2-hydroxychromene-2-carboxylate isomerase
MRFQKTNARFCQASYVYYDDTREAERYNVPQEKYYEMGFGPTERIYSLYDWAEGHGKGLELLYSFTLATFAEGLDRGKDATMKHVVERLGLSWEDAKPIIGHDDWLPGIKKNEDIMLDEGLWGVPSFRVTEPDGQSFSTWGADRLWLLEAKIVEFAG